MDTKVEMRSGSSRRHEDKSIQQDAGASVTKSCSHVGVYSTCPKLSHWIRYCTGNSQGPTSQSPTVSAADRKLAILDVDRS